MAFLSCSFNNIDIGALTNTSITKINIHDRPNLSVLGYKLSRQDGSKLVNAEYTDKMVTATGYIAAADRATYEANRDTLMGHLGNQEGTLSVTQGGATRLYVATVADIVFNENQGGMAVFEIQFFCSNPLGKDATATTLLNAVAITAATSTQTIAAIAGTIKAFPQITVRINSLTGGTNKYIKITNPADGKVITVTRGWATSDVLVIDCLLRTVTVNGNSVDYTGVFPSFAVGATSVQYDDNLTTRNVSLSFAYVKQYL